MTFTVEQSSIGHGDAISEHLCDYCKTTMAEHVISKATVEPGGGIRDLYLCCSCYIRKGNPPASWHRLCVETWEALKKGGLTP